RAAVDGLPNGNFIQPTIFADVSPDARIAREEIFGPVLSVLPFRTEDEAIRLANDTPFGLAGAVWTRDVYRGIRVLKQIKAGILWLNTYHPTYKEEPWGASPPPPLTTGRPGASTSSPGSDVSSARTASSTTSRPSRSTSISRTRL